MLNNTSLDQMFTHIKHKVGNAVRLEFEKSGTYPKSGVKYPTLPNRSSSPNQSPATQTGYLHSKIDVDVHSDYVMVGSDVNYLKFLELGTKHMKPRNGLQHAFNNADVVGVIDEVVKKVFR